MYSVLIDIIRSPEVLKVITKSTIEFLLEKNLVDELSEKKNYKQNKKLKSEYKSLKLIFEV